MAAEVDARGGRLDVKIIQPLFGMTGSALGDISSVLSADGQRFLARVQVGGEADQPLTVVQNWMAGMTRRR